MNKQLLLRLSLVVFLLAVLYFQGASLYLIGFLALFFAVVFLLRGRFWKKSEDFVGEKLPFTKGWPGWARWGIVFLLFLAAYYVFKLVLYSLLASLGFDVQGEMARALNATG